MTEGDADALRASRLRAIDWGKTMKVLTAKAIRWGLSPMAAEDLVQETFIHFIKRTSASWDHEADPTAYRALLYVMDWKLDALRKLEKLRQEKMPTTVDSEAVDETPPVSDRGAEGRLIEGEWVEKKLAKLRAGLAGSSLTLRMVDLYEKEGLLEPRQVAERLGVDVKAVYTAEAQLQRHIERLEKEGSDPDVKVREPKRALG